MLIASLTAFTMAFSRISKPIPIAVMVGIAHAAALIWINPLPNVSMQQSSSSNQDSIIMATLAGAVSVPLPKPAPTTPPKVQRPKPGFHQPVDTPRPVEASPSAPQEKSSFTLDEPNSRHSFTSAPASDIGVNQRENAPAFVMPSSNAAYLNNPKPPYPAISRRLHEQGLVILRVLINTQGQAEQTELYQSSGYTRLDDSALKTVSKWRFVPGTTNGVPQAMWFNVPVNFVLE
jgi:protein TonB